jgi:flavin reductase (DIM6/NTAB) family NADH-FMN oxidoreductase RutF
MDIRAHEASSKDLYKLLTGLVVPRPIAFVSTKGPEGIANVAPFSFFNAITSDPPTIMFAAGQRRGEKKDTVRNIKAHPWFVVNVVSESIAQEMHNSAADFAPNVSEFEEVGLTPVKAQAIDCMAVKESPAQLECKLSQFIEVGKSTMVLGEVVHIHLSDDIYLGNYKIDINKLQPLARLTGNGYGRVRDIFELERKADPDKLI